MGYSLSWIAVEPEMQPALIERFGIAATGRTSDIADFDITAVDLPAWKVLQWNREDVLIDSDLLQSLSAHGRVVAVSVEEHVMFSSAEEWRNGERVWGVVHSSEVDLMHLGAMGELPGSYTGILQRAFAQQEADGGAKSDVDHIIDIPLDLAESITGYRHDQGDRDFNEITAARPPADRPLQLPIDGVSATTGRIDNTASRWHKEHAPPSPPPEPEKTGFFARLFGKS